jgi:hypothetical protein
VAQPPQRRRSEEPPTARAPGEATGRRIILTRPCEPAEISLATYVRGYRIDWEPLAPLLGGRTAAADREMFFYFDNRIAEVVRRQWEAQLRAEAERGEIELIGPDTAQDGLEVVLPPPAEWRRVDCDEGEIEDISGKLWPLVTVRRLPRTSVVKSVPTDVLPAAAAPPPMPGARARPAAERQADIVRVMSEASQLGLLPGQPNAKSRGDLEKWICERLGVAVGTRGYGDRTLRNIAARLRRRED